MTQFTEIEREELEREFEARRKIKVMVADVDNCKKEALKHRLQERVTFGITEIEKAYSGPMKYTAPAKSSGGAFIKTQMGIEA